MSITEIRRAYSYLRFSSPAQAKGDSFRRQATLAAEYAKGHNLELDESLTFHDLGVSAYRGINSETGQLSMLLEAVQTELIPKGSVILVESLDRISRQAARKALRIFESIVDSGVSLVTINDGREYTIESLDSDPISLLMAILTFIRANEESAIKSRRISAAWASRREHALEKPLTSRCPGWMRLAPDRKSFVLIPEHVATIQLIFNDVLSGETLLSIVKKLNSTRIPVPGGFGRQAAFWQPSGVLYLINNKATIGTLTTRRCVRSDGKYKRHEIAQVEGYYPAIISQEDFYDIQKMRNSLPVLLVRKSLARCTRNLIGGLPRCGHCGSPMMTITRKEMAQYIVCRKAVYKAGCVYESVRYEEVEKTISSRLPSVISARNQISKSISEHRIGRLARMFNEKELDREGINRLLKILIHKIIIYPDQGNIHINWKLGDASILEFAFTPTTQRWSPYRPSSTKHRLEKTSRP